MRVIPTKWLSYHDPMNLVKNSQSLVNFSEKNLKVIFLTRTVVVHVRISCSEHAVCPWFEIHKSLIAKRQSTQRHDGLYRPVDYCYFLQP